jgi:hypothetical protein
VRRQWFLRWDLKENVPIVSPSGEGWVLRNDFWLMSSWEKMRVEEFVEKFFGVKASLGSRFLVAHKMPSWEPGIDYASEIYGEGAKLDLQPKASPFRAGMDRRIYKLSHFNLIIP